MPKSNHKIVGSIIQRMSDKTHTFHLPMVEVSITPFDFTFVTGISTGIGETVPEFNEIKYMNPKEVVPKYILGMPSLFERCKANGLSVKFVKECLNNDTIVSETDTYIITRVFCFYVIGYVFFSNGAHYIPFGVLSLVENIHNIRKYDWGPTILAHVYYGLDTVVAVAGQKRSKSVDCFW